MDNNLTTGALIAVTSLTGLGALLGSIVTAWFKLLSDDKQAEQNKQAWLRQQRYEIYAELVDAMADLRSYYLARADGRVVGPMRDAKKVTAAIDRVGYANNRASLVTSQAEWKDVGRLFDRWTEEVVRSASTVTRETVVEITVRIQVELGRLLQGTKTD